MSLSHAARPAALHPIHAVLLAFPLALFPAALISDIAYLRTAQIQWSNFSAWLIAGGVAFGGLLTLWALIALLLSLRRPARNVRLAYFVLLAAMWLLGLVNAFKHSQDGWSSVGVLGVGLSAITSILILIAALTAFSGALREGGR